MHLSGSRQETNVTPITATDLHRLSRKYFRAIDDLLDGLKVTGASSVTEGKMGLTILDHTTGLSALNRGLKDTLAAINQRESQTTESPEDGLSLVFDYSSKDKLS
jgi:hypothetical protein